MCKENINYDEFQSQFNYGRYQEKPGKGLKTNTSSSRIVSMSQLMPQTSPHRYPKSNKAVSVTDNKGLAIYGAANLPDVSQNKIIFCLHLRSR